MKSASFLLACTALLSLAYVVQPIDWLDGSDGHVKWRMGCDFPWNDIARHSDVPGEDCGDLCYDNSECNYFTYNIRCRICFLKKAPKPINNYLELPGSVCGYVPVRVDGI